jgi:hypothetical protein
MASIADDPTICHRTFASPLIRAMPDFVPVTNLLICVFCELPGLRPGPLIQGGVPTPRLMPITRFCAVVKFP